MESNDDLCEVFRKWLGTAPNLDTKRLIKFGKTDLSGTNTAEIAYLSRLSRKKGRAWRSGWPDFMVEQDGKFFCVEVKAGNDTVKPNQYAMFTALEASGCPVFVWNPKNREALTPFREYRMANKAKNDPKICQDGTRLGNIKGLCTLEGSTVD